MDLLNGMNLCQSCAMPLDKDPSGGGTNSDGSKNEKYCGLCYREGKFTDEGITMQEKIDKIVELAVTHIGLEEAQARQMAEMLIPSLERWKK